MTRSGFVVAAVLAVLVSGPSWAAEVGTVAAVDGSAEIGRGGEWSTATEGAAIEQGDELRTGRPGRLRVVFQDDSVLTLTEDSQVTVDQQVFDPEQGQAESVFNLLRGKLSSVVSEYYRRPGAKYEIKTPTAVGGVCGTEFTIAYDPSTEVTEVVGISGKVWLHSVTDPTGPGVIVTARQVSTVTRDGLPTVPRRLDESALHQRLDSLQLVGAGRTTALSANSILTPSTVPNADQAGAHDVAPVPAGAPGIRDASDLLGQPPAVVKIASGQLGVEF